MKLAALAVVMGMVAFPQSKGTISQQAKDCAQNFIGNNNTGTITCYNVDKNLAEQISQLIVASKRDGKTLRDISDKMETLLRDLHNQNNITTINQQAPNGINIGPGAVAQNPTVNNTYAEKHRVLSEDNEDHIAATMKAFSGHAIAVYVQIPATNEMVTLGAGLNSALSKAAMKPDYQIVNFIGNCAWGDNGITILAGKQNVQEASLLNRELVAVGVMERLVPVCTYGNDNGDARVIVWITRP
jgi:hypothetical protein